MVKRVDRVPNRSLQGSAFKKQPVADALLYGVADQGIPAFLFLTETCFLPHGRIIVQSH